MRPTAAIHVYGGDFFGIKRSEWNPETLLERPFDLDNEMQWFEEHECDLGVARTK